MMKPTPGGQTRHWAAQRPGRVRWAAAAVAAIVLLSLCCCGPAPPEACRRRAGGVDLTFFVAADLHLGYPGIEEANRAQISAMNRLPGRAYPPGIGGGVGVPAGVFIAGDLTDEGRDDPDAPQWQTFLSLYGSTGRDGLLRYPVYEGTGNHDRDVPPRYLLRRPVVDHVRQRRGGLLYSRDWGDVHVVCLDLYPDLMARWWLKRDLAAVGRQLPVVLFFHYSLQGPFANWWSDPDKDAFARTIEGYNVIGIFHGHFHGSSHYTWRGYDVYNVGACRHTPHSFAVVRVTDDRMTVASWNWGRGGWDWHHAKAINASHPAGRGTAPGPEKDQPPGLSSLPTSLAGGQ